MRFYFYTAKLIIMTIFKRLLPYYPLIAWWCCVLILLSLVVSKFLLSVGMIGLTLTSLAHPDIKAHLTNWVNNRFLWMWSLVLLVFVLSGFFSEDTVSWLIVLKKKTPFLFMPIAFAGLTRFAIKDFIRLLLLFVGFIVLSCCYSLFQYALHYETITANYIYGHVMPTLLDHIRFSLLIAIAIVISAYLAHYYYQQQQKKGFYTLAAISGFLFLFLHLLAVRSGLLAIYLVLLYSIAYFGIVKKQYKWSFSFLTLLIAVLFLCYLFLPSLKTKVNYMRYDWYCFVTGANVDGHSDGGRLLSMQIAKDLIVENPITGVGAGDVETVMKNYYADHYPMIAPANRMLPHNEFLYTWLAAGLVGFLSMLFLVIQLFSNKSIRGNWMYSCVLLIVVSSLFTEPVLEIQVGTAIFVFFPLLLYHHFKKETIA
jgi:O-antigen ligase